MNTDRRLVAEILFTVLAVMPAGLTLAQEAKPADTKPAAEAPAAPPPKEESSVTDHLVNGRRDSPRPVESSPGER